jgi:hypothetical protein
MNATSLHALVVDQHFGELSPEVTELLETYLGENAEARAEALEIRKALSVTEETVLRHPELGRVVATTSGNDVREAIGNGRIALSWLAMAASIALLAVLAGGAGFFVGQRMDNHHSLPEPAIDGSTPYAPRKESPWARYRVAHERGRDGRLVVRVDAANLDNSTLR